MAKLSQIVPVWMGTTCGMLIADAIGIVVGIVLHKHIPETSVKWIAVVCFAGFGLLGLHDALDHLLLQGFTLHHRFLIAGIPLLAAAMWLIARLTRKKVHPSPVQEVV